MFEHSASTKNNKIIDPQANLLSFGWLLHLRWGAILGQILLIYVVGAFFKIPVPVVLVIVIILFETTSNLLFAFLKKKEIALPQWLFGVIMFIDVVLLTVLLAQTGGAMNPFTFLYLLHVVIGAILMRPLLSWALGIFTILCYSSFFLNPVALSSDLHHGAMEGAVIKGPICLDVAELSWSTENTMNLHLQGMLVAFSITTFFLLFFIGRIRNSLTSYYETVNQLKNERAKNEKLSALATLAAGAAHEFSTPLSTIAVAAGEMHYYCMENGLKDEIKDDIVLIRSQVAKCKDILDQLSADAGNQRGEKTSRFSTLELLEDLRNEYNETDNRKIVFSCTPEKCMLNGPRQTILRTLKGLLKNAIDATINKKNPEISVNFRCDGPFFIFSVTDNGEGMDEGIIKQATEPFFTTKETGKGMGLGLFLAKSIAERLGGDIDIDSEKDCGTTVTLRLAMLHRGA